MSARITARTQGIPEAALELSRRARKVTVLTGAGMSAESGVPTFREAQTGLWARYDPMTLATPEAFADEPETVWAWYAWRRNLLASVEPNAGHRALAQWGGRVDLKIATQNVDDLHERAGSAVMAHLHGSLFALRCFDCDAPYAGPVEIPAQQVPRLDPPSCATCRGHIRPGVVWFGEQLPQREFGLAEEACESADLVVVIGTSGMVYPAAGLPIIARAAGVPTLEINPMDTDFSELAEVTWRTTAAIGLPQLVEAINS